MVEVLPPGWTGARGHGAPQPKGQGACTRAAPPCAALGAAARLNCGVKVVGAGNRTSSKTEALEATALCTVQL